jgi:hypothetical protein
LYRLPQSPLFAPLEFGGDGADVMLADRVAALDGARQKQDRLMDVWGDRKK